ncbi:MAG: hypothetical protein WCD18_18355, partial [Thermosynechococcaceae cyanobacterium]
PTGDYGAIQYRTYNHGGRLNLWDLRSGKAIASKDFTAKSIYSIPIAFDRDRVLGVSQGQISIWNLNTKTDAARIPSGGISELVVSANGQTIAGIAYKSNSTQTLLKLWQKP